MDKAIINAIEEVCKRCHLYTKHCGMLEYPSQCVHSGHFIDGYRKAEKDLALTGEDMRLAFKAVNDALDNCDGKTKAEVLEDALQRFNEQRKK